MGEGLGRAGESNGGKMGTTVIEQKLNFFLKPTIFQKKHTLYEAIISSVT